MHARTTTEVNNKGALLFTLAEDGSVGKDIVCVIMQGVVNFSFHIRIKVIVGIILVSNFIGINVIS